MALEINQLHQGDCVEKLAEIEAGTIDLCFADPPFNIGYKYDVYDDRQDDADYLDWCQQWMAGVHRALRPNGTFWLAIGDEYAAELKVRATRELGFVCRSWVIWYYTFGVNCKNGFSRSHTHLFHFVKDPNSFTFNSDDPAIRVPSARQLVYGDGRANPKGRLPDNTWVLRPQDLPEGFQSDGDTWYFPRVAGTFKERQGFHGCQMPEQLLGRIVRACSNPGDTVLDPFAGSGTTLVVAKKLGRQWLGAELSEEYATRIARRLDETQIGDSLSGVENPLTSVPNTANGKRHRGASNSQPQTNGKPKVKSAAASKKKTAVAKKKATQKQAKKVAAKKARTKQAAAEAVKVTKSTGAKSKSKKVAAKATPTKKAATKRATSKKGAVPKSATKKVKTKKVAAKGAPTEPPATTKRSAKKKSPTKKKVAVKNVAVKKTAVVKKSATVKAKAKKAVASTAVTPTEPISKATATKRGAKKSATAKAKKTPAPKSVPTKKAAVKKRATKTATAAVKKSKGAAPQTPPTKKVAVKKVAVKKRTAKKSSAAKVAPKKVAAEAKPVKTSAPKKAAVKKRTVKKSAVAKVTTKKKVAAETTPAETKPTKKRQTKKKGAAKRVPPKAQQSEKRPESETPAESKPLATDPVATESPKPVETPPKVRQPELFLF
ncbi:DNA methyltransferase [Rosistilla ulvae]|uniref:DNA methyltransferase n=1 Tax=Rosistilla ulvae TaxID=1930277 RepID=UPI001FE54005|nr:DNA methyltransferase [Rosistilla ulvae]